ncbi:hypothetical protein FisN_26Hh035 [Fistulifera solaris]|uniref:Uncharacterized protein n=1 Tax=Fistulifera solaris TaxID=1519565 RepID=A0A1Z5JXZ5_FISSO|nr:hypothetical protein FisN_26Hh035 [Fistulifera solaris]|eukprot:GAX18742.1 hypothetical protein FisN_26Hh035 [Fistulifera solaris]
MEVLSAPSSSHNDSSLETKTEEPIEDETQSSTEHETRKETEETNNNTKSNKRNKNASSSKPATGNYNRYFLSNFKIENIFSFQKRHDVRLSQDKVGLILSDPSAFEKLQEFLRQEGCVTDGTLRVNYNDLLRTRLNEIEENHHEESKDSDDDDLLVREEIMVSRPFRRRPMIPEGDANAAISEPIPAPTLPDLEYTTPAKENRSQIADKSNMMEDGNPDDSSSLPITSDQATKSTASSSPTSVMDMMDLDMKGIDQVVDTFESYEEEQLSKDVVNDDSDEFVEDDSSVDSGLFVENRTFSRPAASAPVAARPWGPDAAPTKEEKIWDICAVEAPATTMDFDHLWEDDENSDVDLYPYRRNAYDYSSDEDVYNDVTPPSKKEHSEPTGSSNDDSWQSQSAREIEFSVDAMEPITQIDEKPRVRFSSKKEFHYPSPGHDSSTNEGSDVTQDIDFQMTREEMKQRKSVSLPKKRITRRQKRHHVVETLEI